MLAYLKGQVIKKTNKGIIINTGNIGYLTYLNTSLLSEIEEFSQIELFIHSHIKEDAFELYGFTNYKSLQFFTQLININGIGPKVALEILNIPISKIKGAILNNDETFLCEIPGIGKKTAKRIILELKEKIEDGDLETLQYRSLSKETHNEALEALIKLGYQKHEIVRVIKDIPEEIKETEEIITFFLRNT